MALEGVSVITTITNIGTAIIGWVGQIITLITSNELLLISVGFFCVGGAVALLKRCL